MANSILTPTQVLRKILQVLHQKLNFVGNIHRDYDSNFAKSGAKIGSELTVRLPNEYLVTDGAALSVQDTVENSVVIPVDTQKHVGMNFTSEELTLHLDDFTKRIIEPAMAVLAASVESDCYNSLYKDVYNVVDNDASALTFKNILQAGKELDDNLAPMGSGRYVTLSTGHQVTLVDALKALFQDGKSISRQYKEGYMSSAGGFDFFANTHVNDHTTGTAAKTTGYLVNGAAESGAAITVDGGSTTFLKGDVVTFAGVNRVHPETKLSTGVLQKFVVTADSGASAVSLAISPSLTATGARQNVTNVPADNAAIVKIGAGASELMNSTMAFHKDAFVLATADLVMPGGVDFASRQSFDGITMRIVKQYDINSDRFPCRVDILYGKKTLRPQLAARIHADG